MSLLLLGSSLHPGAASTKYHLHLSSPLLPPPPPLFYSLYDRSDEHDEHYGIRMCVGGTSEWTGTRIGGIATLNSFGWINNGTEVYRDAFAFSM